MCISMFEPFSSVIQFRLKVCMCDNLKGNSACGARAYWVKIDHKQVTLDGMSTGQGMI